MSSASISPAVRASPSGSKKSDHPRGHAPETPHWGLRPQTPFAGGRFSAQWGWFSRWSKNKEDKREETYNVLDVNFFDEIRDQLHDYEAAGGRFIVPLPYPRIVGGAEG